MAMSLSQKDKKQQLARLRSEVNDFHPLLQALLPKLPRVVSAEYTHGPNEKGADFVVMRLDDTLDAPEYIGILAKIGKITKSLTAIYDQIDDCSLKRYSLSGKSQIQLDEIWVITNETISKNAQEKIHERFASTKIKFVKNLDLIRLIDKYLEHFWTTVDVPVGEFLANLRARVEHEEQIRSLLPEKCGRFSVKLKLAPIELNYLKKGVRSKQRKTLSELIESQRITVIEVGPGAGKSHMLHSSILDLSVPETYVKNRLLPIYVSYVELYRDYDLNVDKLLASPEYASITSEIASGAKLVFFVDGFDELILEDRNVTDELEALVAHVIQEPNRRLVMMTRPLNILDYGELLPQKQPGYEIEPLSLQQILEFFKHICRDASISNRLIDDIKNKDLFKQLPRSPISAILLAQVVSDNAQDLPSNVTDVYTRFSELMLGRWDVDKGLQSHQEFEAATNILMDMAIYFVTHDLTCIGDKEARQFFTEYLSRRNLDIEPDSLFKHTVTRSSIVQTDATRRTVYFKHRSFAEYFYALRKFRRPDKDFVNHHIYSVEWRTIWKQEVRRHIP